MQIPEVQDLQLQIMENIVEIPEIQTVQGSQTESLGTAPVCQLKPAEPVEVVEFGPHLPAESGPPMFLATPVVEASPLMVDYVHPALVVEYVAPAPAVTCARRDLRSAGSSGYRGNRCDSGNPGCSRLPNF